MNDGISHKAYKTCNANSGWDSEFVWGISNSNIKCSSIYHGISSINECILPIRRSVNNAWFVIYWFYTNQAGRNLSLDSIDFSSKLLRLPFLIIIGELHALMQMLVLIQLGS